MAGMQRIIDKEDAQEDEFHKRTPRRVSSSGNLEKRQSLYQRQNSIGSAEKIKRARVHAAMKKVIARRRSGERKHKFESYSSDTDLISLEEGEEFSLEFSERSLGSYKSRGSSSDFSCDTASTYSMGEYSTSTQGDRTLYKSVSCSLLNIVDEDEQVVESVKAQQINRCLEKCKADCLPKKKLYLDGMDLLYADIPIESLLDEAIAGTIHKLSLSDNHLQTFPEELVRSLPTLKHLHLSNCKLTSLPDAWNLPQLRILNLSHNGLDFLSETILEGLPNLEELNMFCNKVTEIAIPRNFKTLKRLKILDLGNNNIHYLPDDLSRLKSLRTLKLKNNFLTVIPVHVCEMNLKTIDISQNEVTQPPSEECKSGILSMREYYLSLRREEQSKNKRLAKQKEKMQKREELFGKNYYHYGKTFAPVYCVQISEYEKLQKACKSKSITLKMIRTFVFEYGKKELSTEHKRKDGDYNEPLVQCIYEAKPSIEIINYLFNAGILERVKKKLFNEFVSYRKELLQDR